MPQAMTALRARQDQCDANLLRNILRDIFGLTLDGVEEAARTGSLILAGHQIGDRGSEIGALYRTQK